MQNSNNNINNNTSLHKFYPKYNITIYAIYFNP